MPQNRPESPPEVATNMATDSARGRDLAPREERATRVHTCLAAPWGGARVILGSIELMALIKVHFAASTCANVSTVMVAAAPGAGPPATSSRTTSARSSATGTVRREVPFQVRGAPRLLLKLLRRRPMEREVAKVASVLRGRHGNDVGALERTVQAVARLRALARLNRLVSSSLAYEDVLAAIAHAASDLMSAPVVSFWVVDEASQTVTVRAFSDPSLRDDFPLTSSRFGQGMAGRVAAERRPLHVPDVFAPDSPILARDWFVRHGLSSFYGIPVIFQERVLAVLALNGRAPFVLDEEDQEILASLVAQAAVSIRNAGLFAQAEARRLAAEAAEARLADKTRRLEVLHRLALGLTATLGGQAVFNAVARAAVELFGDVGCSLWLLDRDGDGLTLMADEGIRHPELRKARSMKVRQGLMGTVVAERRAIIHENIQERGHNQGLSQAEGFRTAMAVPLLFGDRCYGGLSVRRRSLEPFGPEDVDLLTALAGHAAITIEQARLYEDVTRTNAELRGHAEALQAKNAELDSFAYAVSHDLKAPLVTLEGMAGLLLEDYAAELGEEGRHYLARMTATVGQMETLIRDVLALSRVGREGRPTEVVSLDEVVDVVLERLAEPIRARGVAVTRGSLGEVRAIRTQVEQLFANLIGNAVKYLGDTAAPAVEIGRTEREFYVRDNGIGIDPAYHARIFETFQRLKDVEVDGTGIGLAIVKKIVEGAGGRLRVESAAGAGATFFFTWPQQV